MTIEKNILEKLYQIRVDTEKGNIEERFRKIFERFLQDGDRILFQGNFLTGVYPLVLDSIVKGERLAIPYDKLDSFFISVIRDWIDRNPQDHQPRKEEILLGSAPILLKNLRPYLGKEVLVEITTFPLVKPRDGILRKVEHVRYFDKTEPLVPLAEIWYGRSLDGSKIGQMTETEKNTHNPAD